MKTDDVRAARREDPSASNDPGENGSGEGGPSGSQRLFDRLAEDGGTLPEQRLLILLADDDDLVRSVVRLTLEDQEYDFLEAATGLEAIELCTLHRPDLAILDWRMPGATGIEVIERLQEAESTMDIPTILLTANDKPSQIERGCRAGARAFLIKPFSPLELVRTVETVFSG